MGFEASTIPQKLPTTSSATRPNDIAANNSTPTKAEGSTGESKGLANLKGPELTQMVDKLISCVKADGCPESTKMLEALVSNNGAAKNLLSDMTSKGDDPKAAQIAKEVLKTAESTETQRNKNAPVIAQA